MRKRIAARISSLADPWFSKTINTGWFLKEWWGCLKIKVHAGTYSVKIEWKYFERSHRPALWQQRPLLASVRDFLKIFWKYVENILRDPTNQLYGSRGVCWHQSKNLRCLKNILKICRKYFERSDQQLYGSRGLCWRQSEILSCSQEWKVGQQINTSQVTADFWSWFFIFKQF